MDQRISLITLGYRDLRRARDFYTALGWEIGWTDDDVVFFQAGGQIFALWDRAKLAQDSGVEDSRGWGGITLAYVARSPQEVDDVLRDAEAAGATIARAAGERPWGGYSGIFIDPEGHPWEVAQNPSWHIADDGSVYLS